jgi:hypothetical protein
VETHFNGLRAAVLATLARGLAHSPSAQLHLAYIPELSDPLTLAGDERRAFALIQPPAGSLSIRPDSATTARLITLDCRKVAAYLLETHPALDDPLLESSITQAWHETAGSSAHDPAQRNDELDLSRLTISGWIVSSESASGLAQRFRQAAPQHRAGRHTCWVRWFCPDHLHTLWPTLTAPQRHALLGDATWVSIDPFGQLKTYQAQALADTPDAADQTRQGRQLSREQFVAVENVPTVRDILERWRDQAQPDGAPAAPQAVARAQSVIQEARALGLRGQALAAYALLALDLPDQARADPAWRPAVDAASAQGLTVDTLIQCLPAAFWQRASHTTEAPAC